MSSHIQFILFWTAVLLSNLCTAVPIPIEQENVPVRADENSGRQIQNILDIPQQVASFIGNALFPTTPTTTVRTTTEQYVATRRAPRSTSTKEPSTLAALAAATAPVTPRIKYVYVTPPPPRVVIVKPRPFAPAVAQAQAATQAPIATETVVTEAVEGGDEDEDTEEEGI